MLFARHAGRRCVGGAGPADCCDRSFFETERREREIRPHAAHLGDAIVVDAGVTTTTSFSASADFRFTDADGRFRVEEGDPLGSSSDFLGAGEIFLEYGAERVRLRYCSELWVDFLWTVQEIESDAMGRFGVLLGAPALS
ncbi:hypothetical protein OG535_17020 [Kitasatospora sp. NBC_00085]|uniref:hypothetical protein n=1 Tax=unclassified Kitasatospora TaxID=2633591 RepID=UPI0032474F77